MLSQDFKYMLLNKRINKKMKKSEGIVVTLGRAQLDNNKKKISK